MPAVLNRRTRWVNTAHRAANHDHQMMLGCDRLSDGGKPAGFLLAARSARTAVVGLRWQTWGDGCGLRGRSSLRGEPDVGCPLPTKSEPLPACLGHLQISAN